MNRTLTRIALTVGASLMLSAVGSGQVQTGGRLAFDVASVRENKSGGDQGFLLPKGSQFNAQNYRLRSLIQFAYRVQPFELVGGPDWIDSARFDINARAPFDPKPAPVGAPAGEMEQMVQTLLAERFRLQVHRETREMPIYALVLARRDGQPGSRLRRSGRLRGIQERHGAWGERSGNTDARRRPADVRHDGRWRALFRRGRHARDACFSFVPASCSRGGRSYWSVRFFRSRHRIRHRCAHECGDRTTVPLYRARGATRTAAGTCPRSG